MPAFNLAEQTIQTRAGQRRQRQPQGRRNSGRIEREGKGNGHEKIRATESGFYDE
jgi:hypothetical protein